MRRLGGLLALMVGVAGAQAPAAKAPAVTTPAATDTSLSNADIAELSLSMASGSPPPLCVIAMKTAAGQAVASGKADMLQKHINFNTDQLCTTWLLLTSDQFKAAITGNRQKLVGAAEAEAEKIAVQKLKAMSQQNGASTGTSGGTSVTSKGLAAKVLSLASEYGALTQSVSGNTTTAAGSLSGVPFLLLNNGVLVNCSTKILALTPCGNHKAFDYLTRISYSVSFDTSSTASTATATPTGSGSATASMVMVTGSSRSISAFGGKWVVLQGQPKTDDVTAAQKTVAASAQAANFAAAIQALQGAEDNPAVFLPWYVAEGKILLQAAQSDPTGATAEKIWEGLGTQLASALGVNAQIQPGVAATDPVLVSAQKAAVSFNAYVGLEETTGALIARPPMLSVEYDANRPVSAPSNSVVRVIYQHAGSGFTVTANGAFSIYNSPQNSVPGASRLRDVQFAGEIAHDFKVSLPGGSPTLFTASAAFYDQYQNSPAILNVTPGAPVDGVTFVGLPSTATQVYGQTGNLALGQLKLSVGSGSAVTVPLSVTYSNRTELITQPTWKAQIGVSYDFDSLFGSK